MKAYNHILLFLYTLANLSVPEVAAAQRIPKWVTKPPQNNESYLYFVGVRSGAATVEEGQRDAIANAVVKLVDYFGIEARRKFEQVRTELTTKITDEFRHASSRVHLSSTYIEDWIFRRSDHDGMYEVFVLLRYPRDEFEKEKARQEQAYRARQQEMTNRLVRAEHLEKEGRIVDAIAQYLQVALLVGEEKAPIQQKASESLMRIITAVDMFEPASRSKKTVRLVYRGGQGFLPLRGMPVRFSLFDGTTISTVSDDSGLVVSPSSIPVKSVQVDVEQLLLASPQPRNESNQELWLSTFIQRLSAKCVRFSPPVFPLKVLILISESNIGVPTSESVVANTLMKHLRETGFTVVSDVEIGKTNIERIAEAIESDQLLSLKTEFYRIADIVIHGRAETQFSSDNLGYTKSCSADGVVKATEFLGGTTIAVEIVNNVIGFGTTENLAGREALLRAAEKIAPSFVSQIIHSSFLEKAKTE